MESPKSEGRMISRHVTPGCVHHVAICEEALLIRWRATGVTVSIIRILRFRPRIENMEIQLPSDCAPL